MPQKNFIEIDSFSSEDLNDMFNAIAKKIAHMSPLEARERILELSGSKRSIETYKATMSDVLKIITIYDIPMKFRVEWLANDENAFLKKVKAIEPKFEQGLVEDSAYAALKEQRDDITNPDLKDVVVPPVVSPITPEPIDDAPRAANVPYSEDDLPF